MREQHLTDREEYLESLEESLWDQDENDTGEITVEQVQKAFASFDPDKAFEEIGEVLARTLAMPLKSIKPNKTVAIPAFLQTIKGMSITRRTKKES